MPTDTFAERLKHARVQKGRSQNQLAILNGISPSAIRGYEKGPGLPQEFRIPKLAKTLGVNEAWLLKGDGPMHPAEEDHELMPVENEYEFTIEAARHAFAKRNGVPVEQVELLFQLRFPPSPVGTLFPA